MIRFKGIRPNNETVPVYSLSLYNSDQNKRFIMKNSIGWEILVLTVLGTQNTPQEDADGKHNLRNATTLRNYG